ncbi:MAG: ThiF family adenylyltransferase [Caldilineaceae bacterium]|nr:ThiF family adenylyltransferase [Caldilineaceae bacterium]
MRRTSVAMTAAIEEALFRRLVRDDGQEDLCLATYRPSTGFSRFSALIREVVPPEPGDCLVHGNATVTASYILRGAEAAQKDDCGLVLLHSHPGASHWQTMSGQDRDCEASYANLVREITGLPLVGMTLAAENCTWSARHWNVGVGRAVDCTHSTNVRVIGDKFEVSWNDAVQPPPRSSICQTRTVSAWGDRKQADLVRRRVLVVGAGSVGLDVFMRLAASGLCNLTIMDYDVVEAHNLDRLIGAERRDARLRRPKIHVARREAMATATAAKCNIEVSDRSICEPDGLRLALDHDLIFSCVDRPWPRAVLNSLAYSDLIPVIDGGIAIDTFDRGEMRNATWRSHVIRPGRPCMGCNRQLDLGLVALERQGLLDDPTYIQRAREGFNLVNPNVAPLSVNVTASILAQYVSFSVAPAAFGDPGPLQYALSTHHLEHRDDSARPHCATEVAEGVGDHRVCLTGLHKDAEQKRQLSKSVGLSVRLLRLIDDGALKITTWLNLLGVCPPRL